MPGTRHEPAAAAPARVTTVRGWRDLRTLEPALDALHRAAGIPVTARLAWSRAAFLTPGWRVGRGPPGPPGRWRHGRGAPAPPVPGIGFGQDAVPLGPGIRSGLDRSGHRIRQHALTETISFEREPARLAELRDEIEAVHLARDHDAGRVSDLDDGAGIAFWRSVYDGHVARGELEVATLRLDGHLAAYVVALADSPVYRVFDGRFAPKWRLYSPGRRLEGAVVEHARRRSFRELDWMSSVAPEKLVARTQEDPRWAVIAVGDARRALPGGGGSAVSMAAAP